MGIRSVRIIPFYLMLILSLSCGNEGDESVTIRFDSSWEVSGKKFTLEEISPGLPSDWDSYEYVVLEFMITTPQRFLAGFSIETGYNELTPIKGVDSIGIRMQVPIGDPVMQLRSVSLAREDPGDQDLGEIPVVGEFGQYNLGEWEGRVHTLDQLMEAWEAEDRLPVDPKQYGYSKFGGFLEARIDQGTGFFNTARVDRSPVRARGHQRADPG